MNAWAHRKINTNSLSIKGFTIIELLVVVVVIAILAAITIVGYNGIQDRARASAFVSTIDAYEKEARLYKVEQGSYYSATHYTGGTPPDYSNPQLGYTVGRMHVCMPGEYPANGDFAEDECLVQYLTYTWEGESAPVYSNKLVYDVSLDLRQQMNEKQISSQLPIIPLDNGYRWAYSITRDITAAEAESYGIPNPRAGRVTMRAVDAFRGIAILGDDPQGTKSVYMIYKLKGDQACGRGTKSMQNIADSLNNMANSLPGFVYETTNQIITSCLVRAE